MSYVLRENNEPALYIGKSRPDKLTEVTCQIDTAVLNSSQWIEDRGNNYQALVGKVVYVPQFFAERPIDSPSTLNVLDENEFFGIDLVDKGQSEIVVLDNDTDLPPSLYDISTLKPIISDPDGTFTIEGSYIYRKETYQRFFGRQYLTGGLVMETAESLSYSVMPYIIQGVEERDGKLLLKSLPFVSELKTISTNRWQCHTYIY